jgi:hypothetical protein
MVVALYARPMVHFFRAGTQLGRRDLTEGDRDGNCTIAHHSGDTIVEHIRTAALAGRHVKEREELLVRASGFAEEPCLKGFAS